MHAPGIARSFLICAIGDSRTFGAGATLGCDPVSSLCNQLKAEFPQDHFLHDNRAVNGTTAKLWLYSNLLPEALASFHASAHAAPPGTQTFVQIMLGINDASGFGFGRSPLEEYIGNMRGLVAACKQAAIPGFAGVVLHQSFYAVPGGFAPEIDEQCLRDTQRFNAELAMLVDGASVFLGDTEAYDTFKQHPSLLFDQLHASNEGNSVLAALWAKAYRRLIAPVRT